MTEYPYVRAVAGHTAVHYGSHGQAECVADYPDMALTTVAVNVTCRTCRGWLPIGAPELQSQLNGPASGAPEDARLSSSQSTGALSLHRCLVCGTRWLLWPDGIHGGGWNLLDKYQRPGACCDNVAMGQQIEHLRDIPLNGATDPLDVLACRVGHKILKEYNWLRQSHPHTTTDPGCGTCQRIDVLASWIGELS